MLRSSVFLGPNGAGDDYDQMIAGLIRPDVGWVELQVAILSATHRYWSWGSVGREQNLYWRLTPKKI